MKLLGVRFRLGVEHAGATVHVTWDPETIAFFDHHGTHIVTHHWPPAGTTYARRPPTPGTATVTDVLTHRPSPMS